MADIRQIYIGPGNYLLDHGSGITTLFYISNISSSFGSVRGHVLHSNAVGWMSPSQQYHWDTTQNLFLFTFNHPDDYHGWSVGNPYYVPGYDPDDCDCCEHLTPESVRA